MDSREVLQFVDEVVHAKTGKHLNDLQRGIIEGTLKRRKYSDIAEDYNCTTGHTKEVGYELWRILSEIFGEPVDKKSLQSVLERQSNLNIFLGNKSNNIINCINFGSEKLNFPLNKNQSETTEFQQNNNSQLKQEQINRLRQFGLTDEQIAEVLELPLEAIKWVEMKE
ncbi:hypothetical protein ACE1CI_35390 [Aerosakkonemataceae cyanobacterium BLCC-F50]|uniref:vWA-MoxR associated protein N-terminal HTH domain-containing protein n=1 Tax=Floridaenema flaviceps BLCC-F50 TaxID=3153642 RepID=A0ABV4Y4K2_9CYAN